MEERATQAIIPPPTERKSFKKLPIRRFKYDALHKVVRCPAGKFLRRTSRARNGWVYQATTLDCRACVKVKNCVPDSTKVRTVLIVDGYEALTRARRARQHWDEETRHWYDRHKWRVEGVHGEAKTQHGLRRAVRRGLTNVSIQVYLTAAVMNLKRLATHAPHLLRPILYFISVLSTMRFLISRIPELCRRKHPGFAQTNWLKENQGVFQQPRFLNL